MPSPITPGSAGGPLPRIADSKRARRRSGVFLFGLVALTLMASVASAHNMTVDITCNGVTFNANNFGWLTGHTADLTVSVDGTQVIAFTWNFDYDVSTITLPLHLVGGPHSVVAHADFVAADGFTGTADAQQTLTCEEETDECVVPGAIHSGFNGTAVVGVASGPAFIWFNSNLSAKNLPAGTTIHLTDSQVIIDGVAHDVPDGNITFAAVACATTTYDAGTNSWNTTVPLAGSDEILISGLAFPVTNLPGGAQVTWLGNFSTNQPGICLSWKWGAAAYKYYPTVSTNPLVIDYNAAGIKPTHSGACGMNNGDHAGAPQNPAVRSAVTGGARGGGGSNFTGSWSGTGKVCPVCPPTAASMTATLAPEAQEPGAMSDREVSFGLPSPNPTAGPTMLNFSLPQSASISLDVYDVSGRWVRGLAKGEFGAGRHTLNWDLRDRSGATVSRGIYFVRLNALGHVVTRSVAISR